MQLTDASGDISRVVLLFEGAENQTANMTVGTTYYIAQLNANRVAESIVPIGSRVSIVVCYDIALPSSGNIAVEVLTRC